MLGTTLHMVTVVRLQLLCHDWCRLIDEGCLEQWLCLQDQWQTEADAAQAELDSIGKDEL
jgi:hypothetical protein